MTNESLQLQQSRILIVDDDPGISDLLRMILQREGYSNVSAMSRAEEAAAFCEEFKPDIILLDWMMPGRDGGQILGELSERGMLDTFLPILVLTAATDLTTRQTALQLGAHDFLTKPFDRCEVLLRLRNLLQTRYLYLELECRNSDLRQEVSQAKQQQCQLQAERERVRILSQRLLETQEAERRHIARELHDEIGQSLTALHINMHTARTTAGSKACIAVIDESIELLERTLSQTRRISRSLRPSLLDELGLVAALRALLRTQSQRAALSFRFETQPREVKKIEDVLTPAAAITCFRVAQEATTNIIRHANACSIEMRLARKGDRVELIVRDDGCGFDVAPARQRALRGDSLGLLAMEERAQLAGGCLKITSSADAGTEVRATFPVQSST